MFSILSIYAGVLDRAFPTRERYVCVPAESSYRDPSMKHLWQSLSRQQGMKKCFHLVHLKDFIMKYAIIIMLYSIFRNTQALNIELKIGPSIVQIACFNDNSREADHAMLLNEDCSLMISYQYQHASL